MENRCNPQPSLDELRVLFTEMHNARDELIDMIETPGPLEAMWIKPKRYFVPGTLTLLPLIYEPLHNLIGPVRQIETGDDLESEHIAREVILHEQIFELVRREIISGLIIFTRC